MVLEFSKMLMHQYIGNIPAIRSPHLPLDFKLPKTETLFLLFLKKRISKKIKKYKIVKKKNKDHHQYCQTKRCVILELLVSKKEELKQEDTLNEKFNSFNIYEIKSLIC